MSLLRAPDATSRNFTLKSREVEHKREEERGGVGRRGALPLPISGWSRRE